MLRLMTAASIAALLLAPLAAVAQTPAAGPMPYGPSITLEAAKKAVAAVKKVLTKKATKPDRPPAKKAEKSARQPAAQPKSTGRPPARSAPGWRSTQCSARG